jgi:hypothetical protein
MSRIDVKENGMVRVATALLLVELMAGTSETAGSPALRVLAAANRAMGRLPSNASYELRGSIDAEGRTGNYREAVRMRDGAFAARSQFKLFGEADGYDGRRAWHQDRSAASHMQDAPFTHADSISVAWLKRRGYLQPGSAPVDKAEQETIDGKPATVLTMRPRGGNAVRLAFDDATHLLVRVQRQRPLNTVTESYSDYRKFGGVDMPFAIDVEENGDHKLIHVSAYRRLRTSPLVRFSAPQWPHDLVMREPSTLALASLSFAVVPATINGHTYDFILDTGGHNIITPAVLAELGLSAEGKGSSGGSGPGRVAVSDTKIDELKLGGATMTNQHFTVLDLGNAVKRKGKPDMAGILGLEIFERMAVTIDEPRNKLTITPFNQVGVCHGDAIPLLFDDDQPAVSGRIDNIPAQIGIDVGNGGIPIVLWRWAEAHKLADTFRSGKKGGGSGVGGNNVTYRTSHHDVVIGRTALRDTDVNYSTTPTGYFSSRADSMNLGRTLLQKYAVRFDYSRSEMCIMDADPT